MTGLCCNIFRWDLGDCTAGGVTGSINNPRTAAQIGADRGRRLSSIIVFGPFEGGNYEDRRLVKNDAGDWRYQCENGTLAPVLFLKQSATGYWRAFPEPYEDVRQPTGDGVLYAMGLGVRIERSQSGRWWMFGGNYIMGDSRFSAVTPYPIPVHDRTE